MDLNPPSSDFILVPVIEKTEKLFEDELEEIILIEELSTEMKNLTLGKKTYIGKKKRLLRLLKRCQKIDIRGERLEKLIKEAMSYITQPDV